MNKELILNTNGSGLNLLLNIIEIIKDAEAINNFKQKPLDFKIKILVLNDIKYQLQKKITIANLQKEKLKLKFLPSQALAMYWLIPHVKEVLDLHPLELVEVTKWNEQLDQYYKQI